MGRPGLDPGTLGIGPEHVAASMSIRITWSNESPIPPTSTEIPSNLIPWLHNWLHSLGNDVFGDGEICGVGGLNVWLSLDGSN